MNAEVLVPMRLWNGAVRQGLQSNELDFLVKICQEQLKKQR